MRRLRRWKKILLVPFVWVPAFRISPRACDGVWVAKHNGYGAIGAHLYHSHQEVQQEIEIFDMCPLSRSCWWRPGWMIQVLIQILIVSKHGLYLAHLDIDVLGGSCNQRWLLLYCRRIVVPAYIRSVEASQRNAHPCLSCLACGNDDRAPGAPHLACAVNISTCLH
jgi:hypothetical protein